MEYTIHDCGILVKKKNQWIANNGFGVVACYIYEMERNQNAMSFWKESLTVMFNHSININQKNNHLSTQTIEHKTNKITTYGVVIGQIYVYSK